jgi:hypothetical protein
VSRLATQARHFAPVDGRWKPFIGALVGLIAFWVALGFGLDRLESLYRTTQRLPFNSAEWRADRWDTEPRWLTARQRMIDDLMAQKRLDGLTRAEVEALLGPDNKTVHWRDWHLRYVLGTGRVVGHLFDREWFVVRFGSDGRVAAYRVLID